MLGPCVKEILCTLTVPALVALDDFIDLIILEINTQITVASAQLLKLDIAVAPVNISLSLAQEALDQLRSPILAILPTSTIEDCVDFGDLYVAISDISAQASASIEDFRQDAIRFVSIREELAAVRDALQNVQLPQFTALKSLIAECIVENQ